jgi:cellulose synthase/poly-beta-1,6-N-acetylglucosamine synthase-like glycosyltransferase
LEDLTITSCDADSVLDKDYFRELTREFLTCPKPENAIWQTPIFFDHNIWLTPASVRLLTFFNNAVQVSELSSPFSLVYPLSTYSLSFKLVVDVDYWDPIVISDDWHMFLRCFFAKDGDMTVRSMFLPTIGEPFVGETTLKTWKMVYNTHIRHAWGAADMVYILQQWGQHPRAPFYKKLARLFKIWHDNLVFSVGGIFVAVGTGLSIVLDRNPVVTYPHFPIPYVIEALNVLGVVGMLTIWFTERIRVRRADLSWKPGPVLSEIFSWIVFAVITFVLAGLPVLHAHTKMLFGESLTFERTPKGIVPKKYT